MLNEGKKASEILKDEYVVVFMEDGASVQDCKSFKYNVSEIMNKYYVAPPSKIQKPSKEFQAQHSKFMKRAYKELLEDCSRFMQKKEPYKTMYTLDGEMLETMDDLRSFCEEESNCRVVNIKLSQASPKSNQQSLNSVSEQEQVTSRKLIGGVSFIVGKHKPIFPQQSVEQLSQLPIAESAYSPSLPDIKRSPFSQQLAIDNLQEQSQILIGLEGKDRLPKIILLSTTKEEFSGIMDLNLT